MLSLTMEPTSLDLAERELRELVEALDTDRITNITPID